ncbi:AMP-binding protein [soil metagenome]
MTSYRHGCRPLHEYLRLHARATPSKTAIVWYGRRIIYAELDDLSDRFARCLQDRGIGQGDVVVLFMQNCPQFLVAHYGAQKLGAIVSPCNPHSKAYELGHQVGELDASAIVAGDELLEVVAASGALGRIQHVFAVNYGDWLPAVLAMDVPNEVRLPGDCAPHRPAFAVDFGQALAVAGPFEERPAIDIDDVSLMAYTSGTTGLPKAAMLGYECALFKTAATADAFGLRADDVMLADVPLHHISGMMTGLAVPIYTGATVVLLNRFDPVAVLQAIEACKVSWWYSMAPSFPSVMGLEGAAQFDVSSLRMAVGTSFGVQLTQALAHRWSEFTGGCGVYEAGYGLSETHTCDAMMPIDAIRWGTNGKPIEGVEIRIADPDTGEPLPAGERGEILLRSPLRFKGYWRRPEATAQALRDGWLRTGDIGVLDDEGYITFIGRSKEMIKVWSYSVFPEEVEAILATHPDVRQAAVVGSPDADRGAALEAHVVLTEAAARAHHGGGACAKSGKGAGHGAGNDVAGERLIEWCRQHMSHYKVPRTVVFCDALPSSGSGKLLRRELLQAHAAQSRTHEAGGSDRPLPPTRSSIRDQRTIARLFEMADTVEAGQPQLAFARVHDGDAGIGQRPVQLERSLGREPQQVVAQRRNHTP